MSRNIFLDTEIHYEKAYANVMKRYGMTFVKDYQLKILGCDADAINKFFVDEVGIPCSYKEFQSQKDAEMAVLAPHSNFLPGIDLLFLRFQTLKFIISKQ